MPIRNDPSIDSRCFAIDGSYDVRDKPWNAGETWSEEKALGRRATFGVATSAATPTRGYLAIGDVRLADEGVYHCRVDFQNSPAHHSRVKLNVVGESRPRCPAIGRR